MRQASGLEFAQTLTDLVGHGNNVLDVSAGECDVDCYGGRPGHQQMTNVEETIAVTAVDGILDAAVLDVLVVDGVHHGFAVVAPHPFNKFRTKLASVFLSIFFGINSPTPPKPSQPLCGLVGGLFDELTMRALASGYVEIWRTDPSTLDINPQTQARPGFPKPLPLKPFPASTN